MTLRVNSSVDIHKLKRIEKLFRDNPNRVFIRKDFIDLERPAFDRYMNVLLHFNVIEKVDTVYLCGNKYTVRRDISSFKLKRQK